MLAKVGWQALAEGGEQALLLQNRTFNIQS